MDDPEVTLVLHVPAEQYAALTRLAGGVMAVLPKLPEPERAGLQLLIDLYLAECER